MRAYEALLKSHPEHGGRLAPGRATAARQLEHCASACTICADACLSEDASSLRRCIRLTLECADICALAGRSVLRHREADATLLRPLLAACVTACQLCRDECDRHAPAHDHCRLCAMACRDAMRAVNELLGLLSDSGLGTTPALTREV